MTVQSAPNPRQNKASLPGTENSTITRLQLLAVSPEDVTPCKNPNRHALRNGEVKVYRRNLSSFWHCSYRLPGFRVIRVSTRRRILSEALRYAGELYDEARFRQRLGLAPLTKSFRQIAQITLAEMAAELAQGQGKKIYQDYAQVLNRYLIPWFGDKHLVNLTTTDIGEFEAWRNAKMGREPKTSTLLTFAAVWSKVQKTALDRGWISGHQPIPKLNVQGQKSEARPAFDSDEIQALRSFMTLWISKPVRAQDKEMRYLIQDYAEFLILTGVRQGTEAMGLRWSDLSWHEQGQQRYLRIWVSGKTGPRHLFAKNGCIEVFERILARRPHLGFIKLSEIIQAKNTQYVFAFSTGIRPHAFNHIFRRLLRDAGLEKNAQGQVRTLYSLRHSYATAELLSGTDIHTLARQMGTSVIMLERFYSKLTATMAAPRLA